MADTLPIHAFAPGSVPELINGFLPAQQRDLWQLAFKIRGQLLSLAGLRPETAGLKFAWWEQELELLKLGQPRHPLTVQLHPYCKSSTPYATWLNEHLIAARATHAGQIQSNLDELRLHAFRSYGPPLFLSYTQVHDKLETSTAASISQLCLSHVLCQRGEQILASKADPNEWRFLPETEDDRDPETVLAELVKLASGLHSSTNLVTGVRSIDMLKSLTDLRLNRLQNGRKTGRLTLLFSAWKSARRDAKRTMESQA